MARTRKASQDVAPPSVETNTQVEGKAYSLI